MQVCRRRPYLRPKQLVNKFAVAAPLGCLVLATLALATAPSASALTIVQVGADSSIAGVANHADQSDIMYSAAQIGQGVAKIKWSHARIGDTGSDAGVSPSLGEVGNSLVIAAEATDHSLNTFWQPTTGGTTWTEESVAAADSAYSAPWVTTFQGGAVVVVTGPSDSLDAYMQPAGSSTWTLEQIAGAGSSHAAPFASAINGTLVIATEGPQKDLQAYVEYAGSSTWTPELISGSQSAFSGPTIARVGSSTVIAVEGPGNSLYQYVQAKDSTAWVTTEVAGSGTVYSRPSVAGIDGTTFIAAVGPSNSLNGWQQLAHSSTWTYEAISGSNTAYAEGLPQVAHVGDNIAITFQGPNYELSLYWQTIGTTTWNLSGIV
jgi:hypothetical protein